ncbi:MAG: hypothetical protein DRH24_06340 [Deltaproteobacteria bacterium]|nr:MAG: hypothetical protein DRH24_06340 [Deltaproteobacteria bacterium]
MGTYNGSPFLAEQLQSIQNQDLRDWTLLVRDDGSKDDTCNIVADFTKKDNRIVYISDDNKHLGVIGNYGRLMRAAMDSGAETIFFSDQDDVWLPYKMSRQIRHMAEFERLYGRDTPVLIHSDLKVVDKRLNTISDSFMVYQGIANESKSPLKILLAQNFVTGCATVINRPLLEIALPIPENVMMHDWWIALCAAACGKISYIQDAMLLYRQHGKNEVGAKGRLDMLNPIRTNVIDRWTDGKRHFLGSIGQADSLGKRVKKIGKTRFCDSILFADNYAGCVKQKRMKRLFIIYKMGIRRQGLLRQAIFYLRLLLIR